MGSFRNALEGVKVIDLSFAATGPIAATCLGAFGAKVIRIESSTWVDLLRTSAPYKDGIAGINRSFFFSIENHCKYSVAINLSKSKGMDLAKRLVAWADVVIQSFAPGARKGRELGYEELKKIKSDIILINSTLQGETGPHATFKGFGHNAMALSGFSHLTGWPDREGVGVASAYTDLLAWPLAVIAIVASLDYRRRTGKGQFIELPAYEVGITALRQVILDYVVNNREQNRRGNRSESAAPHGVYRCQGEDRWCAISVSSDRQWRGFCQAIGKWWIKDKRFATLIDRKRNEDELDKLVEEYTTSHSADEVRQALQDAGVPAGVVSTTKDVMENDAHIAERQIFWKYVHPEMGEIRCLCYAPKLSKTPAKPSIGPPCLGEHTEYVCKEILGMSDAEFIELVNEGILE